MPDAGSPGMGAGGHDTLVDMQPDPVFDRKGLVDRVQGKPDLLKRVVELFYEELPAMLGDIRSAIDRRDPIGLTRASHTLKGSVGNFGASDVLASVVALEVMGYKSDLSEAETIYAELDRGLRRLEKALYDFVDRVAT